jgi:hypothetical protein
VPQTARPLRSAVLSVIKEKRVLSSICSVPKLELHAPRLQKQNSNRRAINVRNPAKWQFTGWRTGYRSVTATFQFSRLSCAQIRGSDSYRERWSGRSVEPITPSSLEALGLRRISLLRLHAEVRGLGNNIAITMCTSILHIACAKMHKKANKTCKFVSNEFEKCVVHKAVSVSIFLFSFNMSESETSCRARETKYSMWCV